MAQVKKNIFLNQILLEDIVKQKKGVIDSEENLKLSNGLTYKLEPALIFQEEISGQSDSKGIIGKIFTLKEITENGYDYYMDNVIIEDFVYLVQQGFKGTLVDNQTKKEPVQQKQEEQKLTDEQLLSNFILSFSKK